MSRPEGGGLQTSQMPYVKLLEVILKKNANTVGTELYLAEGWGQEKHSYRIVKVKMKGSSARPYSLGKGRSFASSAAFSEHPERCFRRKKVIPLSFPDIEDS